VVRNSAPAILRLTGLNYALVHFPEIDTERINLLRKRYDPQVNLIEPHITLMFPIPEVIGENNLVKHVMSVLGNRKPFQVHLQGLERSSDDYLFLMVQEGLADITALHDEIYTGVLAAYRKTDLPYVPHLTLGVFAQNANEYTEALAAARRLDLDYRWALDKIHLLKIDDGMRQIVWSKEFSVG